MIKKLCPKCKINFRHTWSSGTLAVYCYSCDQIDKKKQRSSDKAKKQKREYEINYRNSLRGRLVIRTHYINTREKQLLRSWKKQGINITYDEYENLLVAQDYCCAICGINESDLIDIGNIGLGVDHNHKTNKVRGLLCPDCNKALGLFRDNLFVIKNSLNYLLGFTKNG